VVDVIRDVREEKSSLLEVGANKYLAGWISCKYEIAHWCDPKLPDLRKKGWIPGESETSVTYRGENYRKIYLKGKGKKSKITEFDGAILKLVSPPLSGLEKACLDKKILVEIKSAKIKPGGSIDGNAHERFSFQNMEYLEIASLYQGTQLLLLTNDVFLRSRNKYHTAFGVHAIRLANVFPFYEFDMVTTSEQYVRLFKEWEKWLLS